MIGVDIIKVDRVVKLANIYKNNKARYNESVEEQKIINLQQKNAILEELKQLIASEETLKKTYDEFKVLQERWKESDRL